MSPPGIVFHPATGIDADALAQVQATLSRRILRAFVGRSLIEQADAKEMLAYQHSGSSVDAGALIATQFPPPGCGTETHSKVASHAAGLCSLREGNRYQEGAMATTWKRTFSPSHLGEFGVATGGGISSGLQEPQFLKLVVTNSFDRLIPTVYLNFAIS